MAESRDPEAPDEESEAHAAPPPTAADAPAPAALDGPQADPPPPAAGEIALGNDSPADDEAVLRAMLGPRPPGLWLTRFVFLRALGFIYVVAFLVLNNQMLPLIGSEGLMPLSLLVARLHERAGFWRLPMLFWF